MADARAFLVRAVTWAAGQGIGQFADLGPGLPSIDYDTGRPVPPPLHEAARTVRPGARFAYIDADSIVVSHTGALVCDQAPGTVAACADLTDPAAVLADAGLRTVIDPGEAACVLLGLVPGFLPAHQAREVAAGYAELLAPGSVVALSVLHSDDTGLWRQLAAGWPDARLHNHSRPAIASFLGALELVPPGIALGRTWRGGMPDPGLSPRAPVYVLACAGRKGVTARTRAPLS